MPKNHKRVGENYNLIQMKTLLGTLGSFILINSYELSKIKGGNQDNANTEVLSSNSDKNTTAHASLQQENQKFTTLSNVLK